MILINEIKFWIMSWGSKALVLETESLREEIRAEAEAMLEKYGEDTEKEENPLTACFLIYFSKSIDIGMDLDYSDVP